MALDPWIGWGVSTMALYFLNKNANSASDSNFEPESLNVNSNQTKIGSPVPVVMGRCLVKSPLVIYFGDFRADRYTETYSAHAEFSAWPIVLSALAVWISTAVSGHTITPHTHQWAGGNAGGPVAGTTTPNVPHPLANKEDVGPQIMMMFAQWLLSWLINGRNLKTTLQKGFKYYLGYQMLVCWSGENLRIRAIYLKEKKIWEGDASASKQLGAPHIIKVNDDELFGGPDEQGGFVGELHAYLGGENQDVDQWMAKQMQAESIPEKLRGLTPAYRPFVSVVVPTAYIGKSATIPETWIELQNCPNRLGLGAIGEDANPAEVLYELHVNTDWGLAEDPNLIDKQSLIELGKTLADEKIGVSVQLGSKTQAQNLIDNICQHINAVKYMDPQSGRLAFRLVRDDYDIDLALELTPHNCSSVEITRPGWADTISEVSVAYTDRKAMYEQSTIPAVDPANIEINRGIKTTKTYSYTYFTTAENALWAAKRELNQQGYPLAAAHIEGNRQLASARIGEVVRLDWAPYGIKHMLLRVTNVDLGDFIDGTVKIDAMEDVFALTKTDYTFTGSTEWQPPEYYPTGVRVYRFMELPWEICQTRDTFVAAFAAKPDEVTEIWTVWRKRFESSFESTTSLSNWTAAGRLVYDYEEFTDAEDAMGFEIAAYSGIESLDTGDLSDIPGARRGDKLLVVDDEIMAYSTLYPLPNGHWYVKGVLRGVFDTVPKKHTAQSSVFFIRSGHYANVTTGGPVCKEGNTVFEAYNITTATVKHREEIDYMKSVQMKTVRRSELPIVPGRIRLGAHLVDEAIHIDRLTGDLKLSWIPRNKLSSFGCAGQDDKVEYWSRQPFKMPEGYQYLIRVSVGDEEKEYIVDGEKTTALGETETVTKFTYSWEQRCMDFHDFADDTRIKIYAKNGELLSYQPQERQFKWLVPVVICCAENEADGKAILDSWCADSYVMVPQGLLSGGFSVPYTSLPIILLGTKSTDPDQFIAQDGTYFAADRRVMAVTGKGTYEIKTMADWYTLESRFVPDNVYSAIYYQWNGGRLIKSGGIQ